ncbi:MAG: chemotaxis protein CheA [Alphaproteobacteria bacterium]|nr:MAG: chemotaxis protein CheA [Alphaproteobacteria bacterium]
MSQKDELRVIFFQECEDLLEQLTDGLSQIESGDHDTETVNAVFRSVHSIKGGAAAFSFDALVNFSHAFENVLDGLRSGRFELDAALPLVLSAGDRLHDLVEAARNDTPPPGDVDDLIAMLDAFCGNADPEENMEFAPTPLTFEPVAITSEPGNAADGGDEARNWRIRFTATPELYESGNDPIALFRALEALGALKARPMVDDFPQLSDLECDRSELTWELVLSTPAGREDIGRVFEFVSDLAPVEIQEEPFPGPGPGPGPAPAQEDKVLPLPQAHRPVIETAAVPHPPAQPSAASAASESMPQPPSGNSNPSRRKQQSIRVDLERVDRLINLVGELVISETMLSQSLSEANLVSHPSVSAALGRLQQLSTELQERIMAIRAQSVKPLFQRMARIVREAAVATGTEVRLVTEGSNTEVDKTVIERLADPLTHILRNAVDHGIESPEERRAAGKPAEGTIRLSAAHRSGQVVIEVSDDGAGIDREQVLQKAREKGLVGGDADLNEQEVFALLFEPGFSTASKVSDLSGRGVGMDVVRTEIKTLGGHIGISSVRGRHTTVTISLPLTLAVVEGMQVEVAGQILVVPSAALRETLQISDARIFKMGASQPVLNVRGVLVPVIDLGHCLGLRVRPSRFDRGSILLTESVTGAMTALVVDRTAGQREVVIKGLTENYGHVPGISAATILGDGTVALIIDIDQIAQLDRAVQRRTEPGLAIGA